MLEKIKMTRDEVLSEAEKCGVLTAGWLFNANGLEKLYALAYDAGAAAENEACAQVAEAAEPYMSADLIRKRRQK